MFTLSLSFSNFVVPSLVPFPVAVVAAKSRPAGSGRDDSQGNVQQIEQRAAPRVLAQGCG